MTQIYSGHFAANAGYLNQAYDQYGDAQSYGDTFRSRLGGRFGTLLGPP